MTRLTQDTDEFVMVIPGKALDIVNGSVQRVTPSTSLRLLTENVVDSRTGISRHGAIYEMHTVEQAGFALPSESTLQTFFSENQIAVVVGCFTPENRQSLLAGLPKALRPVNPDDDAALVASLYVHFQAQKHKYAFLSQLEGDYAFCIFDERSDSCLASRSAHGSHALYQGVDVKTGGLVVTNAILTSGHELTEIPADNFIFGKFRERHLHVVPRGTTQVHNVLNNQRALAIADEVLRKTASVTISSLSTPKSLTKLATVPRATTTPSSKGTADRSASWRRMPAQSTPGTTLSAAVSTTASAKGTADSLSSWKRVDVNLLSSFAEDTTIFDDANKIPELDTTSVSPDNPIAAFAAAELKQDCELDTALEQLVSRASLSEALDHLARTSSGGFADSYDIGIEGDLPARPASFARRSGSMDRFGRLTSPAGSRGGSLDDLAQLLVSGPAMKRTSSSRISNAVVAVAPISSRTSLQVSMAHQPAPSVQALKQVKDKHSNIGHSRISSTTKRLSGPGAF